MAKFYITKDAVSEEFGEKPGTGIPKGRWNPDAKGGMPFVIYDDDDNLYYRGRFYPVGTSDERLFMPLDWAMNNAGATYIKYRNPDTGKWEIL